MAANGDNKYNLMQSKVLSYCTKVIAEEGYEKASIRRIAKEMGMSISALYYYFPSKEALLFSIQYTSFEGLLNRLEGRLDGEEDPESKLYLLIENHLEHFLNRLNELTICSHEIHTLSGEAYERVLSLRRKYYDIALKIVEEIRAGVDGAALEAPLATLNLFGMLNWIYMWYDPKKSLSHQVMAQEIYHLFMNGINSKTRSSPCNEGRTG